MHGYESTPVAEIRRLLQEEHEVTDPDVLSQTKKVLVELLIKKENDIIDDDVFDDESISDNLHDDIEEEALPIPEVVPAFDSPEWHDYVMRQFNEDELDDGNPTCPGCRRLVQKLIGPIRHSGIRDFVSPHDGNKGTATVVYEVVVMVKNDAHPLNDTQIEASDIADVNQFNTDAPFSKHPSATAATRAEGRVYRKLLGLRKITAEEASIAAENEDLQWVQDENIEEGQITVIDMMCQPNRCDLSVMDFINCGKSKFETIHAIPKSVAGKMIQKLNDIQQGVCDRPQHVGRYEADWRE